MRITTMIVLALGACTETEDATSEALQKRVPLKTAKILIEHNATDGDTGFQVFADGEPWKLLAIEGPDGEEVFTARPRGKLRDLGMTEMFLETNEPPNDEVPIPDVLAHMPAGRYGVEAVGVDGIVQTGHVDLTHAIPRGPEITTPVSGAEVSASTALAIAWKPVNETIDGRPAVVTYYQVIVSRVDEAPQPGFGHTKLDVIVPASITRFPVPCEVLAPNAEYEFEVLALEKSGNQTLSSGEFSTY